jgi:serine/threonine-protein kinase SRK2
VELTCLKYVSRPGHPHVVNVLEILDDGRSIYKIEEFAGSELYGVLTDRSLHPSGRFSEAAVRRYFIQILQGVQYLHKKGIVHLDLSLENLLLDDSDNIKIIDFGMARMIPVDASTGERRIFPPHSMRPTNKTFYMAPEVFASGEFDGEKADLWSCTTMLFIMLTGLPAFVYPDSTDTRFLAIKDGNLMALMDSFNVSGFLSDAVKELLVALFVVDFRRRPSVEEILSHRWFTV